MHWPRTEPAKTDQIQMRIELKPRRSRKLETKAVPCSSVAQRLPTTWNTNDHRHETGRGLQLVACGSRQALTEASNK